jgi:hypothetical protein
MTVGLCIPEAVSSGKGEEADAAAAELELVPFAYGGLSCIGLGVVFGKLQLVQQEYEVLKK